MTDTGEPLNWSRCMWCIKERVTTSHRELKSKSFTKKKWDEKQALLVWLTTSLTYKQWQAAKRERSKLMLLVALKNTFFPRTRHLTRYSVLVSITSECFFTGTRDTSSQGSKRWSIIARLWFNRRAPMFDSHAPIEQEGSGSLYSGQKGVVSQVDCVVP